MIDEIEFTPMHDPEARQHLRDALPQLRAMTDDDAVQALVELYDLGYSGGTEAAEKAIKEMAEWLSRLVVAHVKKDADTVFNTLNEFVATRCIVKDGPEPTTPH